MKKISTAILLSIFQFSAVHAQEGDESGEGSNPNDSPLTKLYDVPFSDEHCGPELLQSYYNYIGANDFISLADFFMCSEWTRISSQKPFSSDEFSSELKLNGVFFRLMAATVGEACYSYAAYLDCFHEAMQKKFPNIESSRDFETVAVYILYISQILWPEDNLESLDDEVEITSNRRPF